MPIQSEHTGAGFDSDAFQEKCRAAGMDEDRIQMKLKQMMLPTSTPPEAMWTALSRTQSGDLTRRIYSKSTDYTSFCALMAQDTICPPEYYLGFWKVMEGEGLLDKQR